LAAKAAADLTCASCQAFIAALTSSQTGLSMARAAASRSPAFWSLTNGAAVALYLAITRRSFWACA
jgi:hypothetical protein